MTSAVTYLRIQERGFSVPMASVEPTEILDAMAALHRLE
jgi:hypothetical protein